MKKIHPESAEKFVEKGTCSKGKRQLCNLRSFFQKMDQAYLVAVNAHYASGVTPLA
jgi:hypothetical protein